MSNSTRPFIASCLTLLIVTGCASAQATAPAAVETTVVVPPPSVRVSTAPPATEVPATEAPTTTTPVANEAVIADFETARDASEHCSVDPSTCDFAVAAEPGSPADEQLHELAWMRSQLNIRTYPGSSDIRSNIESVTFDGANAVVVSCTFDAATLYDINDPTTLDDDAVFGNSQTST